MLKQAGYHTVYSTDEVRFANIDESYGFDQVITPRIGASDFLIGTYNELPLASLVINTRFGKWLFPFSYAQSRCGHDVPAGNLTSSAWTGKCRSTSRRSSFRT